MRFAMQICVMCAKAMSVGSGSAALLFALVNQASALSLLLPLIRCYYRAKDDQCSIPACMYESHLSVRMVCT